MSGDRKAWSKPVVMVLTRARSEEAVLNACKRATEREIGPDGLHTCNDAHIACSQDASS
jgi:hypothetical protein